MSKKEITPGKQEFSQLSLFEKKEVCRKATYQEFGQELKKLPKYLDENGTEKAPNIGRIRMTFNKKSIANLGHSIAEMEQIKDVSLLHAYETMLVEAIAITLEYALKWDKTQALYREYKDMLWTLPAIAKANFETRQKMLAGAKNVQT